MKFNEFFFCAVITNKVTTVIAISQVGSWLWINQTNSVHPQ